MQSLTSIFSDCYRIQDLPKSYLFLILAAYVILLSVVISRHEPWMDEAQAWMLAADFSLTELLGTRLRYEGHPALWYLVLFIPAKLGLPYFTVNIISATAAVSAQWLFLRYSPFPPIIKILLPFTFFAFFQYAVIARSYCLIPPLLYLTAIRYRTKMKHPFSYALLLCLLANVSVHTFLMALMLMFVHLVQVAKIWGKFNKRAKTDQVLAAVLFAVVSLQIIFVLMPPDDQMLNLGNNFGLANFFKVSWKMFTTSLVADETARVGPVHYLIALAVLAATLVLFGERKLTLLYLLPLLSVLAFMGVKYSNVWHTGILFFLWIFVLWICFDSDRNRILKKQEQIVLVLLTVVLGVQVYWAAEAARRDLFDNYSGSYQVARYIKENKLEDQKIYASGWKSIAIAPYFDKKIFYNQNQNSSFRIWVWSTQNQSPVGFNLQIIDAVKRERPDVVIIASDHLDKNSVTGFEGYRLAAFFEGNIFWKGGIFEPDSYWLFRKAN
jgi:hypothetical protein